MRDFTLDMFTLLLDSFRKAGYSFYSYEESLQHPDERYVVIRHDVDRNPANALRMARLERRMSVSGTYYFRAGNKEKEEDDIRETVRLGHEIGYHYETLSSARGEMNEALASFIKNLAFFRQFYPVSTISMHGSPLSKHDNRLLWAFNDYHKFGIKAEPYFDMDITDILYISDTGRRWDSKASIRDKPGFVADNANVPAWEKWSVVPGEKSLIRGVTCGGALNDICPFRTTSDIIAALSSGSMPERIMINVHPQRWHSNYFRWLSELALQNLKNVVKKLIRNKKTAL